MGNITARCFLSDRWRYHTHTFCRTISILWCSETINEPLRSVGADNGVALWLVFFQLIKSATADGEKEGGQSKGRSHIKTDYLCPGNVLNLIIRLWLCWCAVTVITDTSVTFQLSHFRCRGVFERNMKSGFRFFSQEICVKPGRIWVGWWGTPGWNKPEFPLIRHHLQTEWWKDNRHTNWCDSSSFLHLCVGFYSDRPNNQNKRK